MGIILSEEGVGGDGLDYSDGPGFSDKSDYLGENGNSENSGADVSLIIKSPDRQDMGFLLGRAFVRLFQPCHFRQARYFSIAFLRPM